MSHDPALVADISAWLAGTDIDVLDLRGPGVALRLVRQGTSIRLEEPPASDSATVENGPELVLSPGVGIFLDRHPLRTAPCAGPGTRLAAGDPVGFLRVGPLLTPVLAPSECLVTDTLAAPGAIVGFGTPLARVLPLAPGEAS